MIPEWMRLERRSIQQREWSKRKRMKERQARAFGDGAYAAAVSYWSRLARAANNHRTMPRS